MSKEYTIRRKVFTLFGAKFHIYNSAGDLIGFSKQKAFKLKEDIRIYTDETMSDERLLISARSVIDFSAAYDVIDSRTNETVGTLQRKGFSSMFRDSWEVMDEDGHPAGKIQEDSAFYAFIRRFGMNFLPQAFHMDDIDGHEVAHFRTHFNPFIHKMTVSVHDDASVPPMLVLAAGILMVAIEGRQQ
ncbi:hypothetical protein [Thalassoroseus pseudoceratinae]|uniref:hypothetical protein n=1 Tax=Thalassoroseus pseudoceratinae TaxID=2713176 RepID=UPI0014246665|nr:hypothetical protein [Thalassoroseus pseudoceratinae]